MSCNYYALLDQHWSDVKKGGLPERGRVSVRELRAIPEYYPLAGSAA